ncbi:hypothetical protein [Natrinema sp. CGMCC1.2065]|uniref:hypothetical protein n=1 Tax=Natrinema sp. CGMCC1.2065 TaxID=3445767 RepID=UPI003F4A01F7
MSRLPDALPDDALPSALHPTLEAYADQGGLLGAFTYFFTYLETRDEVLAETLASIPTDLFVTSALHDDAIDEIDAWDDRKRRLNEHVTTGDLVFANVAAAVADAPADVDLGHALETVREIGAGQLAEESFDAAAATVDDAIARVDERGGRWGDLAVELVAATGGYTAAQLASIRTIATDGLFVLTVIDDLADLPEDVDNGVATLPVVLFEGDPDAYRSTTALVDDLLASDVPDRLEALVDRRRAAIDAAATDLHASLDYSDETLLEAAALALQWYCETVCSVPVAETVPQTRREAIREGVSGGEASTRQFVAERAADAPVAIEPDAIAGTLAGLPDEPLVRTAIRLEHLESVVDDRMHTTVEDALADLRTASTPAS